MFDTTLMAFKAYKIQLLVSIPTMIVSIISSFILIHLFGIIGASLSVVLITFTQAIIKYIIIKILIKSNLKFEKRLKNKFSNNI